ncbi:MAG: MBL fold metallo-hydrolase [Clostridia bacterium]|nr:MBL fold metallo-hydrolase [Clostridia bacterium]
MFITGDIRYIGVNDREIDLFEGQYRVPEGMSYNSYLIMDEKTAVMDTVDRRLGNLWLDNIRAELGDRGPDYLIVQHMEPDHSANIHLFMEKYPDSVIVSSQKAFNMMKNFFGTGFDERRIVVSEGSTLCLGEHTLTFVTAPMVHWPEVIVTYDSKDKVLFSADGFGKFGALTDADWAEGEDRRANWTEEARRYYIGIVGKYGAQVQLLLKKAAGLDIATICPLHGPVLKDELSYYIGLYDTWSSYEPEEEGVVIAYASVYGHTKVAAEMLAKGLEDKEMKVALYDLARCDMAEAVADAFRYDRLVLCTTTYNADIFPFMRSFIEHLTERNFQKRTVGFVENGSWAPMAMKVMRSMLEKSKNLTYLSHNLTINSALNEDNIAKLELMMDELNCGSGECSCEEKGSSRRFECTICGYVHEGDSLPDDFVCPLCKKDKSFFKEI